VVLFLGYKKQMERYFIIDYQAVVPQTFAITFAGSAFYQNKTKTEYYFYFIL
jgi:hypothetical protein